jgi:serine/threonine-protein kinase HipA
MRLKHWSLIYPDRRRAALAPAYDFVSTIAYIRDANAALKFTRTKRFDELTIEELSRLADKALLPQKLVLDAAAKTVALFQENWTKEKKNLPIPDAVVKAIDEHIRTVPLAGR